jgi:sarcosine oxidase subunit alpha
VEAAKGKAFLDLQNDVTVDDIHLALREGYSNVEHVKRYTTGGMGFDQGKTGNINIIGTVALAQGLAMDQVGTTTFRAPYTPTSFGAIGGLREGTVALPYRHTPITEWNLAQGAFMYEAGARWRRPGYFPRDGEGLQEATNRECRAVRYGVGVYDGSPLGTFELKGRDVGRFLDYLYSTVMSSLKPGNGRYGLMLSDDGLIMDDGVCFRLDDHRWIVSTSTGHADAINGHMEEMLQTRFPDWNVFITTVTSQWNNATICGPKAREVMAALGTDIDLSPGAFPFMAFRDGTVAGLPARLVRVSFTGELSFEVNVAPRHMRALWAKVMEAGAPFGILPVGSEASHVLRVEKGFLSLGHEVDGTVDAYDLGMGWAMSKTKPDYLGKRAVAIRREAGGPRRELVGVIPEPDRQIPEGAPLTPGGRRERTEGFVTACVWSVVHERWVGLALLENGHARHGETAHVRLKGGEVIPVRVTAPCHYDPDGDKLRS